MDRRQMKTRQAILAAFSKLLEHETFNRITVQEIIDEANIGRSTFYAHFETKDELLKTLCSDLFDHVFSDPVHSEATHDFSDSPYNLDEHITHVLCHLQDNRNEIVRLLSSESGELFLGYFKTYLPELFRNALQGPENELQRSFLENYLVGSFANTVKWWTARGMDPSPEAVSAYYCTAIEKGVLLESPPSLIAETAPSNHV